MLHRILLTGMPCLPQLIYSLTAAAILALSSSHQRQFHKTSTSASSVQTAENNCRAQRLELAFQTTNGDVSLISPNVSLGNRRVKEVIEGVKKVIEGQLERACAVRWGDDRQYNCRNR